MNKMDDLFRKEYNSVHKLHEYEKDIKETAEILAWKIKSIGDNRQTSLAITNLEQSIMWAIKALYTIEN